MGREFDRSRASQKPGPCRISRTRGSHTHRRVPRLVDAPEPGYGWRPSGTAILKEGLMSDVVSRPGHARRMPVEPQWYKRAVFYEMLVQAGYDSNGDGHGDLPGLISKLDYYQWLGVDCLWLPPFFDSPRRD